MGKYEYKTRPDLVDDQRDYIAKSSLLTILKWIANEQAESNRLKREQILLIIAPSLKERHRKILERLLEDKAL